MFAVDIRQVQIAPIFLGAKPRDLTWWYCAPACRRKASGWGEAGSHRNPGDGSPQARRRELASSQVPPLRFAPVGMTSCARWATKSPIGRGGRGAKQSRHPSAPKRARANSPPVRSVRFGRAVRALVVVSKERAGNLHQSHPAPVVFSNRDGAKHGQEG
jgi:hypothetical protein